MSLSLTARLAARLALVGVLLTIAALPAAAQETVSVLLTEWQVAPVPTSVVEGTVAFQVRNDGAIAHNLVVIKTDLAPDALPVDEDTYLADETQLNVVASSVQLLTGQATEVSVDLGPGSYVLICNNLATHYQVGMYIGFQVTAAPEPTATSPASEPTATPPADGGPSAVTPTPADVGDVTGVPATGQGPSDTSAGSWWWLAAVATAGAALAGLGAAAYRRAR